MATELTEDARSLLDQQSFAVVSTLQADGAPHTSVVWVKRDGNAALFTTTTSRQKARNLTRDPRVSITIVDPANPYHSVEIRGRAELVPDPDRALSRELSHKYLDVDPPPEPPEVQRLAVRVTPERVISFSA